MKETCQFIVIDDHQLFADGLIRILKEEGDFNPIACLTTTSQIWTTLESNHVDLILLDIHLQEQSGLELCASIRKKYPDIKIVLISMIQAPHISKEGLKQGANGYIPKTTNAKLLKKAVRNILDGKDIFMIPENVDTNIKPTLTMRETEIIQLIKNGQTTKAIAEKLYISEYTVETHRKNICRKLGISNATELIAYAYANHL